MGHDGAPAAAPAGVLKTTGRERFAWTQAAEDIAGYKFAVYADGTRMELPGAVCQPPVSRQAECTAPLPPLAPGLHTLQVVSWTAVGGKVVESARSAVLTVEIIGPATVPPAKDR
jgi:hypothetical protein